MTARTPTLLDLLSDDPAAAPPTTATVAPGAFGALNQTLYLTETGDTAAISMNDIHQGQIGDCFLLSPIGDLAATHPDLVRSMIHANADGSETVTLHIAANGHLALPGAASFKTVTETVTNVFPTYAVNSGATQDVVGSTKEIWAQVIEKAVAQAGGGYASIAYGGNPAMAMQELTGHTANAYAPTGLTASLLQTFAAAGDLIAFDTKNSSSLAFNLVGNHAYMFTGIVNTAAGAAISLANPWGTHQPSLIPVSQMATAFAEIDIGRVA